VSPKASPVKVTSVNIFCMSQKKAPSRFVFLERIMRSFSRVVSNCTSPLNMYKFSSKIFSLVIFTFGPYSIEKAFVEIGKENKAKIVKTSNFFIKYIIDLII